MDWICGIQILVAQWLVGRRKWYGWAVYAIGVVPWSWMIYEKSLYGLIPVTTLSFIIHLTYTFRWYRQPQEFLVETPRSLKQAAELVKEAAEIIAEIDPGIIMPPEIKAIKSSFQPKTDLGVLRQQLEEASRRLYVAKDPPDPSYLAER